MGRVARVARVGYNSSVLEPIPLSVSLAGLDPSPGLAWSGSVRAPIAWASGLGVGRVRLDGAAPGMRARELDRGARRDLAGVLRRSELELSGIDLWIPERHFCDPDRTDRAVAACVDAVTLAGDLSGLMQGEDGVSVSVQLPSEPGAGVLAAIEAACEHAGVRVADHGPAGGDRTGSIGAGLDPASVLLRGDDPLGLAAGGPLVSARLSDADEAGRCRVGDRGRLDVGAYGASLSVGGYQSDVVIDPRGLAAQDDAVRQAGLVWARAMTLPG